jgi:hypothetical protein
VAQGTIDPVSLGPQDTRPLVGEPEAGRPSTKPDELADWTSLDDTVRRYARLWGRGLLIWGLVQLLASILLPAYRTGAPWVLTLLVVGFASLFLRSLAMLSVCGIVLIWGAIFQLLTKQGITLVSAAVLWGYLAVLALRQFVRFRRAARRLSAAETLIPDPVSTDAGSEAISLAPVPPLPTLGLDRSEAVFPWLACVPVVITIASYILLVWYDTRVMGGQVSVEIYDYWGYASQALGILSVAFGLSALLLRFRHRFWNAAAMVIGTLLLILFVVFMIIANAGA